MAHTKPDGERFADVMIRMPKDMHQEIKRRAAAEDRPMAAEIRRALRQYLEGTPRVTPAG